MTQFIPRNNQKVTQLQEKLSKTIFKDVGTFVEYYNSGIINKGNDETKETVKEITDAFKDVKERKGTLGFISEAEIILDETISALGPWLIIAKLKREVSDAVAAGTLDESGDVLVSHGGFTFSKKVTKSVNAENQPTEEVTLTSLDGEKLFARNENLERIEELSTTEETHKDEKYYVISVEEVLLSDLDFVQKLKEIVSL